MRLFRATKYMKSKIKRIKENKLVSLPTKYYIVYYLVANIDKWGLVECDK